MNFQTSKDRAATGLTLAGAATGTAICALLLGAAPAYAADACESDLFDPDTLICGDNAETQGSASTAIGDEAFAGTDFGSATAVGAWSVANDKAVAVGSDASADGISSVSIGWKSVALEEGNVAIGHEASALDDRSVAIGQYSQSGDWGTAVGWNAEAAYTSTAFGTLADAAADQSTALGALSSAEAVGATAVGRSASAEGEFSTAMGYNSTADGQRAIAIGLDTLVEADEATAVGSLSSVGAVAGTALGRSATVTSNGVNSVALGADSVADEGNVVSVGNAMNQRRITNVAAGINDYDAVNMQQFDSFQDQVVDWADMIGGTLEGAVEMVLDHDATLDDHESRLTALEAMTFDLGNTLERFDDEIDGSTAVAIAMSGNAFLPGYGFNLTGNLGTYNGAVAGSLQMGAMVSRNAAVNAGVATGFNKKGKVGARVGFTFGW